MRIDDPATLKSFLRRHGLDANKGLGQHFLASPKVVERIVAATDGCQSVVEIGPGPGILTAPLSEAVSNVVAIEIDSRMAALLAESAPNARVILGDALSLDLRAIIEGLPAPVAVVSNMPYYISAPLLQRIAGVAPTIDRAILMMQREVATRISARAGKRERGSLSVYLQAVFAIEKLIDVPPGAFLPPPKVDSAVLTLRPTRADFDDAIFAWIQTGFSQPRKTLANNLSASGRMSREVALAALEATGLSPTIRPHELTLEQWITLFDRSAKDHVD